MLREKILFVIKLQNLKSKFRSAILHEEMNTLKCGKLIQITTGYRKIPKISPGAYIFQRPFFSGLFWRGLSMEGNLRFKIDWAGLKQK